MVERKKMKRPVVTIVFFLSFYNNTNVVPISVQRVGGGTAYRMEARYHRLNKGDATISDDAIPICRSTMGRYSAIHVVIIVSC